MNYTNPFHISESETQVLLDDFQHQVERKIEHHGDEAGFPQMADCQVTKDDLDGYLFDKQAILDSRGTEKGRYTLAAIIIIIPLVILAVMYPVNQMPWGQWSPIVAIGAGLALWGIVVSVQKVLIRMRLRKLDQAMPLVAKYVEAVLNFGL